MMRTFISIGNKLGEIPRVELCETEADRQTAVWPSEDGELSLADRPERHRFYTSTVCYSTSTYAQGPSAVSGETRSARTLNLAYILLLRICQ